MKKLFSAMGFLLLLLAAGCSQVVYRVNPDSPPQMSATDAKDAIALSLTLTTLSNKIENVKVYEDGFSFSYSSYSQPTWPIRPIFNFDYGMMVPEVRKSGDSYFAVVYRRSLGAIDYLSLSWKSEEEARHFVDAAYVLRKRQFSAKQFTEVAAAPSRPVPSKEPVDKGKVADQKPQIPTSAPTKLETSSPPKITVTSPDITRPISVIPQTTSMSVKGIAESAVGVIDVRVNEKQAALDEKGNFFVRVPLKVGRNDVIVTAVDARETKGVKRFSVHRAASLMAVEERKQNDESVEARIGLSKFYALVIAVQDYDSPEINKLDYPVSDALQLKDILISDYTFDSENITLLKNPDRRTIYKALQNLKHMLTQQDNLLIFYAGHGTWMDDMRQGFWLPRDASGMNDPSDWIPNSTIRDYIKAIKAKHILLVADACFSGGIFKVRTAFVYDASVEKIYELPSRKAITSGTLKTVPDRSVFVEFFVKRLKENRERYLDSQKLFTSLREAVINNSPLKQIPLYGAISEAGDEGGDFVFVRRQ